MTDAELDAQLQALGPVEPPAALTKATLAAWRAERERGALKVRVFAGFGMAAMLVASFLVAGEPPTTGDVSQMVERGGGESLPSLDLKVAVRSASGESARFVRGADYPAGTTLLFRVSAPAPADVTLRRNGEVIWSGSLAAGEHDVPVGYTLEAGEPAATFVLSGGAEPVLIAVPAVKP